MHWQAGLGWAGPAWPAGWSSAAAAPGRQSPAHLHSSQVFKFDDPPLHDPCAVAYVIAPHLFKASISRAGAAALVPRRRRGRLSARWPLLCLRLAVSLRADGAAAGGCGDELAAVGGADCGRHLASEQSAQELHRVHGAHRLLAAPAAAAPAATAAGFKQPVQCRRNVLRPALPCRLPAGDGCGSILGPAD